MKEVDMRKKTRFEKVIRKPEQNLSLAEAALCIAAEEYPEMSIQMYMDLLGDWAELLYKAASVSNRLSRLEVLHELLFQRMQFSGNIENYNDPKNSFLNDVIDSRKGIPISLSVIYLELAWRLGMSATGVGFPGHFLVRVLEGGQPFYVDPFYRGRIMTEGECVDFWNDISNGEMEFQDSFLSPLSKKQILNRMLRNLRSIYLEQQDFRKLVKILDKLIVLDPDHAEEIRDRGIVYYQIQAFRLALQDFETYLSMDPDAEEAEVIRQYVEILREYRGRLN